MKTRTQLTFFFAPQMENAMQNCFIKGVMSGVMGFGMGGLFGMFMASVRPPLLPFPPPTTLAQS